jgi:pseudouridine kinase
MDERHDIVCIGGIARDRKYHLSEDVVLGSSNPATSADDYGGIAHNVAVNLSLLGIRASVLSVVGTDPMGDEMLAHLAEMGIDATMVDRSATSPSANYVATLAPDGLLVLGIADMRIFDELNTARFERDAQRIARYPWVFIDTNPTPGFIAAILEYRKKHDFLLAVNTASAPKARRLPADLSGIDYLFLNDGESIGYLEERRASTPVRRAKALRERGAKNVILTLGERGTIVVTPETSFSIPVVPAAVRDDTGAGDALIAGTLRALILGRDIQDAVADGSLLAALTIESHATVCPNLSLELFEYSRMRLANAPAST